MGRYKKAFSLYKRGDYWYYRTYDLNGIRTSAKTTGCTAKGAAQLYCERLFKDGLLWTGTSKLLSEYAKNFFNDDSDFVKDKQAQGKYSINTIKAYRAGLNTHIIPLAGRIRIADVNYSFLISMRQKLIAQGLANRTINLIMATLKIITVNAQRDGLLAKNPFENFTPLPVGASRDSFSFDEICLLVRSISDVYERELIILLALTGMRIKECAGIVSSDIINQKGFYFINLTKQLIDKKYLPLKTKISRHIPIIPELVSLIHETPHTIKYIYQNVNPIIRQLKNAEARKLTIHSLRHFFITDAKSFGVNPLKVESIAGHSLRGIADVYTSFKPEDLTEILAWQRDRFSLLNK